MLPLSSLLKLLVALALVLQLIIISQMYFFGVGMFNDPTLILLRLFRGVLLSFLAGGMLAYPTIALIRYLNISMPWKRYAVRRFFIQFSFAILAGFILTPVILLPARVFFDLEINFTSFVNNAYYMAILSLFLMIILEAKIQFGESIQSKIMALELEKKYITEVASKAIFEAKARFEEDNNKVNQERVEEEKLLNQNLSQEIEKREEISRQLHESRGQLHSLLSNLMGAAYRCRFDEDYTIEYISDKIMDVTGYPSTDFVANATRSYASIIHPDDLGLIRSVILEASESKAHYEVEYRVIHQSGHIVWVSENGKCIFDADGNLTFLDGIIIDITRSKEAELAVKESEKNYKELLDFLPQPIFELNLEGKILLTNKAGDDFFGKLPEDLNNRPSALSYFIEEDRQHILEKWQQSSKGLPTDPGEFTGIKGDGSLCPVMIFGNPIYRNNTIVGRRGIIIDISERKKYELGLLQAKNELEQVNNNLEQLVAERSRELMEANTQLLKAQKENLQSQFEVLKQQINPHFLFNSLNVLSGLINKDVSQAQLFIDEFSQIYRYVLESIEKPVVTLGDELGFVRSYMFLQQIRYGEHLVFNVNLPSDLLQLYLPPLSLQTVLENAIKHNLVSASQPLNVEIFSDQDDLLVVRNNLQPKMSAGISTHLGQVNMIKRYALISDRLPQFVVEAKYYKVTLPLIDNG